MEKIFRSGQLGNLTLEQEHFEAEPCQKNLSYGNISTKPNSSCTATDQNINNTGSLPLSGKIYMGTSAGIDSKLEPLTTDPNSNMLRSSVINSSSASFSDGPTAVSDERGAFSVNTSINLTEEIQNRELIPSGLSSDTRKIYNENQAVEAENSVGSPIKCTTARTGKRKRTLDAVEPIECMQSADQNLHKQVLKKLSLLHGKLNCQIDNSLQEDRLLTANLHDNMSKEVESYKKRKSCTGQAIAIALDHLCDSDELMASHGTSGIARPNVCKETAITAANQIGKVHVRKDGMDGPPESKLDLPNDFFEKFDGNLTKLLALDNDLDEECFQEAFARPISPIIPLIEFPMNEAPEICMNTPSICTSQEGFSYVKDNPAPSCDFDVINLEIDCNKQTISRLGSSELLVPHKERYCNAPCESLEINENANSDITCKGKVSGLACNSHLGCNVLKQQMNPSESQGASTSTRFPRYYIVSSNNNNSSSILRIFQTSNSLSQYSEVSSLDMFLQNILLAFQKADDLLAR